MGGMTIGKSDGWIEQSGVGAKRADGLVVMMSAEDSDANEVAIHWVAWMTIPGAEVSGCGHPGGSVPLEFRTLSAACDEANFRWPMRAELERLMLDLRGAEYDAERLSEEAREAFREASACSVKVEGAWERVKELKRQIGTCKRA